MSTPREIHNELSGPIVRRIVGSMLNAGGDNADIVILLITIAAGVLRITLPEGSDDAKACAMLGERVKVRLRELRKRAEELNAEKPKRQLARPTTGQPRG